jgi:hypothetical protein
MKNLPLVPTVHVAGELLDGLQRCLRCGVILTDYRYAMVPSDQGPLTGWAPGASIEVIDGNPMVFSTVDEPPNCRAWKAGH